MNKNTKILMTLADQYANAAATARVEDLCGSSPRFTRQCADEVKKLRAVLESTLTANEPQPAGVPEGCTPADARVLREANHALVADLHKMTDAAEAWRGLFWQVAQALQCLPSTFIDGNAHVIRAAHARQLERRAANAAQAQAEPAAQVPKGATHYQPHQKAYYKRISETEWELWSEQNGWIRSPGTSDSSEWVMLNEIAAAQSQPERQPLTDEQIAKEWRIACEPERSTALMVLAFARAIERAHGIGQEGGAA